MMSAEEKHIVIAGLGNPGKKYAFTRHNMGFLVVQRFADIIGAKLKEEKAFHALVYKGKVKDATLHLLLPLTYMNESGQAVKKYLTFYKLGASDLIVVADDVEIPFSTMRLRDRGSPGGHNGLKSIQAYLGTQEYRRLKVGIGKDLGQKTLSDHVLEVFSKEEQEKLPEVIERGALALQRLLTEDILDVMQDVNSMGNIKVKQPPCEGLEKQV